MSILNVQFDRRKFLAASASAAALAGRIHATPMMGELDLTWAPAWQIRDAVVSGSVTALAVTNHFLERINALDSQINAFSYIDGDRARAQASSLDAALRNGEPAGPLHGVPISVKDHIAVKGAPHFNFVSRKLESAQWDDVLVERLKMAGAVIIGTNKMPGMGWTRSLPGMTMKPEDHPRNPWDLTRAPGSSSAGGAAAVAAGMVPVAIGSDGGGSTRLPAALSGVIGFHPSRGRVPTLRFDGKHNLAATFGPLARDMRDVALVMNSIAGPDAREFITLDMPPPDYTDALNDGVRNGKFAWTDDFGYGSMYELPQSGEVIDRIRTAADGFSQLGAEVTPISTEWEDFWPSNVTTGRAYGYSSAASTADAPDESDMRGALEVRKRNYDRFKAIMEGYDFLLSPTVPFTAFTIEEWDRAWSNGENYPHDMFAPTYTVDTYMFNWLGWPAISVPCGFVNSLPVGLQIIAPPWREASLIQAAAAFSEAFPRKERPKVAQI